MNTPSAFQQRFPLSRKKFWKKMISKTIAFVFFAVIFGVIGGLFAMLLSVGTTGDLEPVVVAVMMIGIGVIGFLLAGLVYSLYVTTYIRRYYYDMAEHFITIQKGVFAPAEIHVPYNRIQDVYVDQDILDRILGIYDVHIASATMSSSIEAHIDGVDPHIADELKNLLLGKIEYGMNSGAMPSMQMNPPMASAVSAPLIQGPAAGSFNSNNYPILVQWIFTAFITNVWTSGLYTLIVWSFLVGKRASARIYEPNAIQVIGFYLVVFALQMIWSAIWRSTYHFEFLPQFILVKDGVIRREEKHVPYRSLQNVLLERGIVDRMLGLSTVIIENAAMGPSKIGRASRIVIPGQSPEKGAQLVSELNRILGQGPNGRGTGL